MPVGPIVLAGDVNGTGYPLIPTALISIVSPGSAGDSTHIPVFSIDSKGRVTALTQVAIAAGGIAIGDPVSGGSAGDMLVVDGSGNLSQLPGPSFSGPFFGWSGFPFGFTNAAAITTQPTMRLSDTLNQVDAANGAACLVLSNVAGQLLTLCDGVSVISYAPGNPANWLAIAPSDVWKALDRLAAWMTTNFPAVNPP